MMITNEKATYIKPEAEVIVVNGSQLLQDQTSSGEAIQMAKPHKPAGGTIADPWSSVWEDETPQPVGSDVNYPDNAASTQ